MYVICRQGFVRKYFIALGMGTVMESLESRILSALLLSVLFTVALLVHSY